MDIAFTVLGLVGLCVVMFSLGWQLGRSDLETRSPRDIAPYRGMGVTRLSSGEDEDGGE